MTDAWRPDFAAAPPFAPFHSWTERLAGDGWPGLDRLNRLAEAAGLTNAHGLPLRFARQDRRCGQRDYEAGILATGQVPTREDNWHDLFNALCWLAFPRAKLALNAVQCAAIEPGRPRGPVSDAATLFDESGLILVGPDPELGELLAARRWREAFVARRAAWKQTRAYVIGHAILEKLLAPWPGITAKCLFLPMDADTPEQAWRDEVDRRVAEAWQGGGIDRPARLFPLPVLGIPGWWPANEDPDFYADQTVFRPARN